MRRLADEGDPDVAARPERTLRSAQRRRRIRAGGVLPPQPMPALPRTDLRGADVCSGLPPGSYRWVIDAEGLRFATIDDACTGRAALLTSSPWSPATGQ